MMRIASIFIVVLLLLTLLPQEACSNVSQTKDENALNKGPMNSPWPMYRRDMRHTGRSPYGKAGCTGVLKWKIKIGWLVDSSPVIDKNGIIYIGSDYCKLYAIYPNGTIKWTVKLDHFVDTSPALAADGTIYVCTEEHAKLYAIDPDGNIKWCIKVGNGWILDSPLLDEDGIIYVGTTGIGNKGVFVAVYPNGTIKWKINISTASPPAKYGDTIYVAGDDGYLYALYASNGTIKWKVRAGCWGLTSGASIDEDGTIYFSSKNGYLYAFCPNGTLKWKYKIGFSCISPAIAENGTLYVATSIGDGDDFVYAFDPNGTLLWKCKTKASGASAIAIDRYGILYAGSKYRALYAVTPGGKMKWFYEIDEYCPTASSPAIGEDGTIYVAAWDGYLYAIEPRDAADLEITGIHLGFDVGGFRIKVKNVGCRPAHNVTCGVVMRTYDWREDEMAIFEFTTTVPEIDVDEEVVVKIKGMFLNPLHYSPAFWDCSFELLYVEAEDANPDMLWEGGDFYPVTVFGPFVWVGGFILWLLGARGWIEV